MISLCTVTCMSFQNSWAKTRLVHCGHYIVNATMQRDRWLLCKELVKSNRVELMVDPKHKFVSEVE